MIEQAPAAPPSVHVAALAAYEADYVQLRHELHSYPELAYHEARTADLIAGELAAYGLEVHRGLARTGVVGVLRNGRGGAIGLRADIDALDITEQSELAYRSRNAGRMHACGHDGHTAMLLLSARHLSATRQFDGTAVFIFQPAEERGAGARSMINDGLFERFPVDAVFGMHNIPGLAEGEFAVMPGPIMAAGDYFEIVLRAPGAHAALPHTTADAIVAAGALVQSLQTLVSRAIDPLEPAVLSVTTIHGGEAPNAIPQTVTLQGTARSLTTATRDALAAGIERHAAAIASGYGLEVDAQVRRGYPATINTPAEADFARRVLCEVAGTERVHTDLKPLMTAEDFAFMLQARPGAYVWIGNGASAGLHTPGYDFNDRITTLGAAYWVRLVEAALPITGANP